MNTTIKIKDLRLKTIIGVDPGERTSPQEVIVNVTVELTESRSTESDELEGTVDYRALQDRIIAAVEPARFHLLEKLTAHVLGIVMEDSGVRSASVEIDKPSGTDPGASVSVTCSATRGDKT